MRIHSIDAIRGLAILGILFLNITFHQNFYTGYAFFEEPLLSDDIISLIDALFLDGRFRSLFCLLFGAGLAIPIVLTNVMTKHFRQGPFEAIWRKLYLHSFYKKRTKEHLAL
jgi:uncharacterized protein